MKRKHSIREIEPHIVYESCPLCGYEYGPEGGWRWKMMIEPRLRYLIPGMREDELPGTGFTRCPRCSLVHQRYYIEPQKLKDIYASTAYVKTIGSDKKAPRTQSASYNEAWRAHHLINIDDRSGLIQQHIPDADSILDVGCAKLLLMKSLEYDYGPKLLEGVDPSITSKRLGQAFCFQIWDDIMDIPADRQYDLITHIHTLEHVIFPKEHLLKLREHLAPNGHLFILLPNVFSHPALNFFHIFGYSTTTLRWMLELCGFEVDIIKTIPAMWMRWYPMDILCIAHRTDISPEAINFQPDRFFEKKKRLGEVGMKFMRWLPEWIREPRPPKLVAPIFILPE